MIRLVLVAARKDLLRHARDPLALLLWMGIPLFIGACVTLAFGGTGSGPPKAKLLIADQDNSIVSGLFVDILGRDELRVLDTESVSLEAGNARIASGGASALLVIPEGFGQAVLKDTPAELRMLTNPAQSILPRIGQELVGGLLDLVFYAQRILGDDLRSVVDELAETDQAPSDLLVSRLSVSVNGVLRRAERYVFPPVLEIKSTVDARKKQPSLAVLFLPGLVLMALFFLAAGISEDVWRERTQGTLRRAACSPGGSATFFAGKVLAGMCVAAAMSLVILSLGMGYLGLPMSLLPLAVVWCAATAGLLLTAMCWIQMVASSQRAGQILTNSVTFPLLMIGGSFFPAEIMPRWLSNLGRFTPNGWSLAYLKDLLLERSSGSTMLIGFAVLLLGGLLLFGFAERRFRRFARTA